MDQNGFILVHFGFANAKIQFGIRPKWSKMVVWTILVQYTLRQYCGDSLFFAWHQFSGPIWVALMNPPRFNLIKRVRASTFGGDLLCFGIGQDT